MAAAGPIEIEIVPAATLVELAAVRELFAEYARELGVDLCFQGFEAELAGLPGLYARPRGCLLLARQGAHAAGCVALRPREDTVCEMKRLYVRPAFRRSGLGRALAERVMGEAQTAGYRRMVLDTLAHMEPALRLYEALGFRPCPPYYHNPLPGAVYLACDLA